MSEPPSDRDGVNNTVTFSLPPPDADSAPQRLARATDERLTREATDQGLFRPTPLPVHWRDGPADLADHHENIQGQVSGNDPAHLAAAFRRLPRPRLVVLGPAGAGKTTFATLLTLRLIQERRTGDPVPVVVGLAGWDPTRQRLPEWITTRLTAQHPALADELPELVSQRRVLPVLDGLDEVDRRWQAQALEEINGTLGPDAQLILTCRTVDYAEAVRQAGPIGSAAVIEADPLSSDTVAAYLWRTVKPQRLPAWTPVLDRLAADLDGPLARALSTPWAVWLARTVHDRPDTDPADLIALADTGPADRVTEALVAGLIPAVYRDRPGDRPRWRPDQARRWLTLLATRVCGASTPEINWREVDRRVAVWPVLWLIALQLPVAVGLSLWTGEPSPVATISRAMATALAFLSVWGLANYLFLLLVGVAHVSWTATGASLRDRARAAGRWARTTGGRRTATAWGVLALTVLVVVGLTAPSALPAVAVCLVALPATAVLHARADSGVTSPRVLMRHERQVFLVRALVVDSAVLAVLFLPVAARVLDHLPRATVAVVVATTVVEGVFLSSPWGRWTLLRTILAMTGRLPWRTLRFLDGARDRGLLRQDGGVYQFRHTTLLRHLAPPHPTGSRYLLETARVDRDRVVADLAHVVLGATMLLGGAILLLPALLTGWVPLYIVGGALAGLSLLVHLPVVVVLRIRRGPSNPATDRRLRIGPAGIERFDEPPLSLSWDDIERVTVHRTPDLDHTYALYVTRARDGERIFLYDLGPSPVPPRKVDGALVRFAGPTWVPWKSERWTHP